MIPDTETAAIPARTVDLGRCPYITALDLMRRLVEKKRAAGLPEMLLALEHEPVVTLGRRAGDGEIRADARRLRQLGIAVHRIERGGLATYHGPGQQVVYTLFDLRAMRMGVAEMVDRLESAIIDTLDDFGIEGRRRDAYRGVWTPAGKVASIGLAVRRGITFHGLALNRAPELSHFEVITPCGIEGVRMTSMQALRGRPVDADRLRRRLLARLGRRFGFRLSEWSASRAAAAAR